MSISAQENTLYMVSNAHFDTQWDWDVQTSIDQYVKNTLEGNFNLFEKYPNYVFNFEGAIKYKFAKEYYPDLYERLKGYVASGRWHISGGSIDANDVMVPSAESIIRNFLYGQEFYKQEFGVKGGTDIMLPDCFGFPWSLPTLGKHCGIIGFHSQKLSWGSAYDYNNMPHFNLWRGVDGSEIFAVHKPGAYVTQYRENMANNESVLNEILANKTALGSAKTIRYFGTGDRGGSIDESTADWLEKSIATNGPVKVKIATPDQFFNDFTSEERAALPVWNNELPMKTHGVGCYTSQAVLKYWNRKNELLADAAEKASVPAFWLGGLPYQSDAIREAWIRNLWHQFHDDLTGTSIPRAYSFTYNDHVLNQLTFSEVLNNAVGAVSRKLDTQVSGRPIVVYNPLSIERNDVVEASLRMESEPVSIKIYNAQNEPVAAQKIHYQNGILTFIFAATVPSLGYAVYDLQTSNTPDTFPSDLSITANTIENEDYKLSVNGNGDVSSILDKKQNNKELLKQPIRLALLLDQPGYWMSWEISWGDVERLPYAYVDEAVEISIAENGPLRAALKIKRSKNASEYVQYVRLSSGVNSSRIDFINEIDWQNQSTMLKAVFPLRAINSKASYDMSIGVIERGNRNSSLYEVAGHQWADLTNTDNSYGISILNDCKYGWDKLDNSTLRLTLIHTPKEDGDRKFQKYQDLGLHHFSYSIFRHLGLRSESTQWEASKLNQPLLAYEAPKHAGDWGKSMEIVGLNNPKIGIKALKKAENSDEWIVRLHELTGVSHNDVALRFPANIVTAREVTGLEETLGTADFSGSQLSFSIGKYQPKAFAVKLANISTALVAPSSETITLPYNVDVISSDTKRHDGEFGDSGYCYPAELLPDAVEADGIRFPLGSKENGAKNAVECRGQEIALPASASAKKLYLLAASANRAGSDVHFSIDGQLTPLHIEYFAEFVGQWGTMFSDRKYKKENVAFTATHRHNVDTRKNESYSYLYLFKYLIPIDENVQKLILPDNPDVIVFAAALSDNANDDVQALSTVTALPESQEVNETFNPETCAPLLVPVSVTSSGYTNDAEKPIYAADNNSYTKWCNDASGAKWLQYNFGKPMTICHWKILHGALEGDSKITVDFSLQRYENGAWIDVDEVTNNISNRTSRALSPFVSDRVRLRITKPEQSANVARIYSMEIFGTDSETAIEEIHPENQFELYVNENHQIVVVGATQTVQVFDVAGRKMTEQSVFDRETVIAPRLTAGIYIVKTGNKAQKTVIK
ncbi:MAG: discoidin domain-containing protein [Candidatus Symbiothrix sp.]|nr:discoidin domain-containing protein [Candidatus Symbiothrix sp.]